MGLPLPITSVVGSNKSIKKIYSKDEEQEPCFGAREVEEGTNEMIYTIAFLFDGRIVEPDEELLNTKIFYKTGEYDLRTGGYIKGTEVEHRIVEPKNVAFYVINALTEDYGCVYSKKKPIEELVEAAEKATEEPK